MAFRRNNLPEVSRSSVPSPWRGEMWDPFRELGRMQRTVDRMFSDLLSGPYESSMMFNPPVDVSESDNAYLISLDLPGVPKDDVRIEIQDNSLIVTGERKMERRKEEGRALALERFRGNFRREFALPASVDPERVSAAYREGVLEITVPKSAASKPRTVKIAESKAA
jgi:HSP20 family protein